MVHPQRLHSIREQFEDSRTDQIFQLFESSCKTKRGALSSKILADAWGLLFSGIYLCAEELVEGMQKGEHLLGKEREKILCEFIRGDAKTGGSFVLEVCRNGGNIDRASLIIIADPVDLAHIEHHGSTALHLLTEACDRGIRPSLIKQMGKKALSELYDARGMPILFAIFGLKDLNRDDLAAIGREFTKDELRAVKVRNRTGRNGLVLYTEANRQLTGREPDERNTFAAPGAVKKTNLRGQIGSQMKSRATNGRDSHLAGTDVMGESRGDDDKPSGTPGSSERYHDMMANPVDNFRGMVQRKSGLK